MKTLIVFTSLTGNTEQVARAIEEELQSMGVQTVLVKTGETIPDETFDLVTVGFWVDRGSADAKTGAYLETLRGQKTALFATLGADPASEHAMSSLKNAAALLDSSNEVVGTFICQGKIDPRLIEKMAKRFTEGHPHAMDEKRRERHKMAQPHPDEADLRAAKAAFHEIVKRFADGGGK